MMAENNCPNDDEDDDESESKKSQTKDGFDQTYQVMSHH